MDLRCAYNSMYVHSSHQIMILDGLLDSAIKQYFLPYLQHDRASKCQEDHCHYEYHYDASNAFMYLDNKPDFDNEEEGQITPRNNIMYACLRWVCQECYDAHQKTFKCDQCKMITCRCHFQSGHYDETAKKSISYCWACDHQRGCNYMTYGQIM